MKKKKKKLLKIIKNLIYFYNKNVFVGTNMANMVKPMLMIVILLVFLITLKFVEEVGEILFTLHNLLKLRNKASNLPNLMDI